MLYSYHRGSYLQQGRGLGGILSTLARWLKPILPKIVSLGKKTIQDPAVKDAVKKIKKEAVEAGSRAINKKLKNIAPTPTTSPIPAKKAKRSSTKASKPPITITKAKKKIAHSLLKTNTVKKPKNKNANIFDQMK